MSTKIEYPKDKDTPVSFRPFSPATVVGDLIFVSGQASVDLEGNIVRDTFEGEFNRSIENMKKILEVAGSDLQHVVQTRCYVADPANVKLFNELYKTVFSDPFPARTTVSNCLSGLHFEIECVAVKKA